ncbi:MAG: ribonuclease activity regulator RraA [Alphaproteobacteria bacterium]
MTIPVPDPALVERLAAISTATLTMQLLKRGIRNVWMRGVRPLQPAAGRVVGPAETWRFVPMREDVSTVESLGLPGNSREAVEAATPGSVVVADACGCSAAGVIGDILAARLGRRGIRAMVTDGAVRDAAGVAATGLPVFAAGAAAPATISAIHFAERNGAIGCGGVMVRPGDLIVADGDGVVVVPQALAPAIAADGGAQDAFEDWVVEQVGRGRALPGLYPPSPETRAEYEARGKG